MKWFYNLKVKAKLLLSFVLVAVIAAVIGFVGYNGMSSINSNLEHIYLDRLEPIRDLGYANAALLIARGDTRNLLLVDTKEERQKYYDDVLKQFKISEEYIEKYSKTEMTSEEKVIFEKFNKASEAYIPVRDIGLGLALNMRDEEALAVLNGDARKHLADMRSSLRALIDLNAKDAEALKNASDSEASSKITMVLIFLALGVVIAVILGFMIANIISKPVNHLREAANKLSLGDADVKIEVDTKDELGMLGEAFEAMVKNIKEQVDVANKISEGDLGTHVKVKSDKDVLGKALNTVIDSLKGLVAEAGVLTKAAVEGKLSTRGNADKFRGSYKEIVAGVNSTLDAVIGPLNVAAEYIDRISKGDIPKKITDNYNGDFNEIKNNLNNCVDSINALITDANMLSKAAVEGKLSTRADATKHQADFRKIVEGVNATLDAVIGPLNVAAEYIDRISKGDIPKKITDNYNGDFNEIKNNLNNCVDSINALIADANMLSKAAVEGKLSTRADATKHQADFRKIVEGVNATLDAVIGPLNVAAEYVDRISKGDIPKKITDNYNGDFNEIKNNLNNCIDNLNGLIEQMQNMSHQHDLGDIDIVIDANRFQGAYQTMATGVNNMVNGHIAVKKKAMACIAEFGRGNFEASLERFPGKKAFINETIEQVRVNLKALIADANLLSAAAIEGRLNTRADASKHYGDFKKIVDGINTTLDAVIKPVQEAVGVIQKMAVGDMTTQVQGDYQGDHAILKEAINSTISSMSDILLQIIATTEQVTRGSQQVADASQSLSQGATEQASSLEEITSSMTEIGSQTKLNAENANRANQLAINARSAAEKGNSEMAQLMNAMTEINESSKNISKIIKVIDEIAFQTNLLALNAAVEAARAGRHGKGFAVVAEEVRNLAARSAKAAKETAELIEGSIKKVENGSDIANRTGSSLGEIKDGATKVTDIVAEIAASSNEQAQGIAQINTGLGQIDKVTQQNTANAEESASAAEELSGQATQLNEMLSKFNLTGGTKMLGGRQESARPSKRLNENSKIKMMSPSDVIKLDDDDFGKF